MFKSGLENANNKYSEERILEVLNMKYRDGLGYKRISKETGIPSSYIRDIVKGKAWRNLFSSYKRDNPSYFFKLP